MNVLPGVVGLLVLSVPLSLLGHGGGLDSRGGHINSSTGQYHCHRSGCEASGSGQSRTEVIGAGRYDRSDWPHWSDDDSDCINMRHEILIEQADGPIRMSRDGCYVVEGVWDDPFSGKRLYRASDLDVDHAVPLKWASDHGGARWSRTEKERFANDPVNLIAVDDGLNQSKSASGPTEWMPPNHQFRCEYLQIWVGVLDRYPDLIMTPAENRTFSRMIGAC